MFEGTLITEVPAGAAAIVELVVDDLVLVMMVVVVLVGVTAPGVVTELVGVIELVGVTELVDVPVAASFWAQKPLYHACRVSRSLCAGQN